MAACQLDALAQCLTRAMLRQALATLPSTLDQTYDRILCSRNEAHSEYAIRILRWLTFSAHPLLVDEIARMVAIDPERDPAFNLKDVFEDPLDVLDIFSSLVTVVVDPKFEFDEYDGSSEMAEIGSDGEEPSICGSQRQYIALAHYSVKQYLMSDRIKVENAAKYGMRSDVCHDALARSCIGYLLQLELPELELDIRDNFGLARYSKMYWTSHVGKIDEWTTETRRMILRLCLIQGPPFAISDWLWDFMPLTLRGLDLSLRPRHPLHYAASRNLKGLVKVLLDEGANANARCCNTTALIAASSEGHEQVVKQILDAGTDVNMKDGKHGTALQMTAERGHKQVVKQLLDAGADPNTRTLDTYSYALSAASAFGSKEVVELLLDAGADVNACGVCGTALDWASREHLKQIDNLLLDRGTNINNENAYVEPIWCWGRQN